MNRGIRAVALWGALLLTVITGCPKDPVPPVVTFGGIPEGAYRNAPGVVTFTVTNADLPENAVVATLDGQPYASGDLISSEGPHTVEVVARNRAGNQTVARRSFTLDFTPPVVTFSGFVDGAYVTPPVTPAFSATDAHLQQADATLDGQPFTPGTAVSAEGTHLLSVTARDRAGNQATAVGHFTIDTTPPVVVVTGVEADRHHRQGVTPGFSATEANPGSVTATLDGADFTSGTEVSTEGAHTLVVTALDAAGNTATRTVRFVLDLMAPVIQVSGLPAEPLVNHAVTPAWTVTDTHLARVEARLDGQDAVSGTAISAPGAHTLVLSAWDEAGNTASQTATFTIDATPPVITVAGVGDGERRNTPATVSWTVQEEHPGTAGATLDGQPFESGGLVSAPGPHTLVVTARDGAGNEATVTRAFVIDTAPPSMTVEAPADGLVTGAADVALVVAVSDDGPLADVRVGGVSMTRGPDGKYRHTLPLMEGGNAFMVEALDAAGNSASALLQVVRDSEAPLLVVTSPEDGAVVTAPTVTVSGTVTDATAVTLTLGGGQVTLEAGGAFSVTQALRQGDNTVVLVATDAAGHQTTVSRAVRRAGNPPSLVVTDPPEDYAFPEAFVTVRGEVTSSEAGDVPNVTVDGNVAAVDARGRFAYTLEVPVGPRNVSVVAVDRHGQSTEKSLRLLRLGTEEPDAGTSTDAGTPGTDAGAPGTDAGVPQSDAGVPEQEPAPVLVVESPSDGTVVGGMRFAVMGRVEGGALPLQVTVNGLAATVSSRSFSASLALLEGSRQVDIRVRDALGRGDSASRGVVVDRTAPYVELTRPTTNPAQVTESPYLLTGTVGDANLAGVTVQGLPVPVVAGGFSAQVSLVAGDNAISVEAVDLAGNRRSLVQHLVIDSVPPVVSILQPMDGTEAEDAIVDVSVRVTGGSGALDVRIGTGAATRGAGGLYTAQVPLSLGENLIPVTATDAQGLTGSASVRVRFRDVTQEPLAVTGADPAPGAEDVDTAALVSVSFNKPVRPGDVPGHLEVWARGAKLAGGYSVAPGAQTATFVAKEPLPEGERVTVRVSGVRAAAGPDMAAPYASEFTVRRPMTVVRGVVMDDGLRPLPGVKVEVEGQALSTLTGPDGNWALVGVRGGAPVVVRYEGGTTSDGRTLPVVRRQLFVAAEQETVDKRLTLVAVDAASAQVVDGAAGGVVTLGGAHGALRLEVAEGGLAFASGTTRGFLTATEIPTVHRPVPVEDKVSVDALWQLGPEQVRFLKPVSLTLPNRTQLPAGRMVVLLGFDERRLSLKRVGLAHVRADGEAIVADAPVPAGSLEFLGYMALTPEQQGKLEEVLAAAGGATGGTAPDGGLGLLRLPVKAREPSLWERVKDVVIASAHADIGNALLSMWGVMDSFLPGIAYVSGQVRSPREHQTTLEMELPFLVSDSEVEVPYTLPIDFEARYEVNGSTSGSESVVATLSAVGPSGGPIAPKPYETWRNEGQGRASIESEVSLSFGSSTLLLTGKTRYDTRAIRLTATLEPIIPDAGGPPTKARLTVRKEPDSTDTEDPFHGVVRFKNLPVSITSYVDTGGMTDDKGLFRSMVIVPGPDTTGIACADIPLGPRFDTKTDLFGNPHVVAVNTTFPVCSRSFSMYPNAYSWADVLVDVRLLYGNLTFKNKDGQKVPATCRRGSETKRDPETGELESLSEEDSATTEVHFFREDDLLHPVARYAVTRPQTMECEDPENPPTGVHGQYSRVRLGPSHYSNNETRARCLQLSSATGPLSPEDESFYRLECGPMAGSFLRLGAGERLVVFAVNHATGYSGMKTVTVPSINRAVRAADGTCPEDAAAGGPLEVREGSQTYSMSRCSRAELGIPGDIDLYPPEIDVRVKRQARSEGLQRGDEPRHLIRTGGAGTTRDDYLQVTTHWRVRRAPVPEAAPTDGGLPDTWEREEEDCEKGRLPDGGVCRPSAITDDDADAGTLLEMYCSELAPAASRKQWETCLRDAMQLADVPRGVPPLAGQIVRVTGTTVEQPAVTTFDVAPGLNTVNVQSSLRRVNASGQQQTLNNLTRANYYLHVVGNRLLDRDTDGDGYVDAKERRARPPNFEEPTSGRDNPPGLPEQALFLKNVFKRYDARGALVDQYDVKREHEFRVLDLEPRKLVATQDEATRDLRQTPPIAQARDLSYQFLAGLLAPDEPGRAGTLSGDYRVRLGTDEFGIDCPFTLDEASHTITANCGGEYVGDILSASDVLYLEVYLSGNAENVLYRFNLQGLAPRKDYVASSAAYTMDAAMLQDDPSTGKPAIGRPVSQPSTATFFVDPTEVTSGTLRLCLNPICGPANTDLLKEVSLTLQPDGSYALQDAGNGAVKQKLFQAKRSSNTGARRFRLPLPPHLTGMAGSTHDPVPVYLVLDTVLPVKDHRVMELGRPQGSYNGANARAVGQETVAGVNVADGHLSFEHVDFALPFLKGEFAFKRVYNNQDNAPTPLGVGWRHNFDGWLLEERAGRYIAVVGGQGFVFPDCAAEPKDSALYGNTLGTDPCKETDGAHGFELRVEAPMDSSGASDKLTLKTEGGWTFEFNRPAKGPREEGHRRWMLTRFSDSHGRDGGDLGWTKLEYEPDSERLWKVTQAAEAGTVSLAFTYEDVDTEATDLPEAIRILARARGFKWMRTATLTGGAGGGYSLRFEQDRKGNLTRVERSPGLPYQSYEYDYLPVASTLKDDEKWEAVNELAATRVIYGNSPASNGPVHWRASYERSATSAPYQHVKAHEMVTSVSTTGMQGAKVDIAYSGPLARSVTWPDGVKATLSLNDFGNVGRSEVTPGRASTTAWGSDTRGGKVVASQQTSAAGRALAMDSSTRLVLQEVSLVNAPAGSKPVEGLGTTGSLVRHVLDSRFGVPATSTTQVGGALATVESPRSDKGDLLGLKVSAPGGTREVFKDARYTADGLLQGYTDAQGREVVLSQFNALGQPQRMTLQLAAAPSGLSFLTRTLSYDTYGRLVRTEDMETGSFESFTHDGLGRVLTHVRSGTPQESWTYTYTDQDDALTVKEVLAKASGGTTRAHERTVQYVDGLLMSESSYVGEPATLSTRTNTYANGRLTSTQDESGNTHVYQYDAEGRVEQVKVGGTLEVAYARDADGNPYTVTDHLGRVTTLGYDRLGRPVFWDWGDGDTLELKLDVQGNPVSRKVGGSGQHTVLMTSLDALGNPQATNSESANGGVHEVRAYDGAGRLARREDQELGLVETYEYGDVLGRTTQVERKVRSGSATLTWKETRTYLDPQHRVRVERSIDTGTTTRTELETLTLDTAGRTLSVVRQVDGHAAEETFAYTERGQVWRHESATGAVTQRFYDPQGTLTKVEDPDHHLTTFELDAAGRVHVEKGPHPGYQCTYGYDALGRLTSKTVATYGGTPGVSSAYEYLPTTKQVRETTNPGDGRTIVTTRRFNARDRLLSEEVQGTGGTLEKTVVLEGPWEKSITVREGSDWVSSTVWPSRDDLGRALEKVESWSAGGQSYRYETTTAWNKRQASVTTSDVAGGASQSRTTQLEVDSLGNVVEVTRDGRTDVWGYDAAGVLAMEKPAGIRETTYAYSEGLLKRSTFDGEDTDYTYDLDGRLKTRTGPDGRQLQVDYGPRGLVMEERFGRPGDFQATGYTYDANGALLSVTEGVGGPDAQTKTFTRGARGELLEVLQPGAGTFTYAHDGLLRLKSVTRPPGGVANESFEYDFLGRQTLRKRDTASWQTQWSGGMGRRTDGNGDAIESLMDGRGRLARVEYQPGVASAPNTQLTQVTYAYTAEDQPWKVTERQGTANVENTFTYDARRLLRSVDRDGDVVSFTYTDSGQRKTVASAAGTVTYGHDVKGRLSSITSPAGSMGVEWESGGERLAAVTSAGLTERRCYDDRGRLTRVVNAEAAAACAGTGAVSGLHSRFDYTYDGRGNRLRETYRDGQLTADEVTAYGYDAADRLTGVRYPDGVAQLYKLTGDGTREAEKEFANYTGTLGPSGFGGASPRRYWRYGLDTRGGLEGIYDELHAGQRIATYVTDKVGRLTSEQTLSGSKDYGWDAAGRLTRVSVQPAVSGGGAGNVTATYSYGWDGLRRGRTVAGQTTRWLWAGASLVEERLPGQDALLYAQGPGMTVSVGSDRIAHDGAGSAVGRVGATDTWHRYDAWGGYRKSETHWKVPGSAEASLGFTGHAFDAESGLTYVQQRWYSPQLGRFLSEDPVFGDEASPASLNRWGYGNGNPTRYVDRDGRIAFVPLLIYAGLTAVIGTEAHVIYQEAAEGAGSSKPIEWGRATTFGGAAGATVLSGGLFGVGATAGGMALGGGFDVASQMIMQGRSLGELNLESAFVTGGYGSLLGGGLAAGMKSSVAAVRLGTGATATGLSVMGMVAGQEHARLGRQNGNLAQQIFGTAEFMLGGLGALSSAGFTTHTALEMAGLEVYSKGLGSNLGNMGFRKKSDSVPDPVPGAAAAEVAANASNPAATKITSGSQVTEQVIREALIDAPYQSQQSGGVSLPMVQRYVDKLLAGDVPPAVKVDGNILVDGNHRYVAGRVLGKEPPIQEWAGGRPDRVVPWDKLRIDPADWGDWK
jgi:RHS repeat-associated protein